MFFVDKDGKLQEGIPLSNEEKQTLDHIVKIFHESPAVCGGYHAMQLRERFDIKQRPDFEFKEVEESVEEVPQTPEYPEP